ncbi:SAM-dependent methyltransferase [Actinomadura sp. 9N407]|uniref:SAM-dependent methyltransferase n=1 Tax=Actinomadura sp. 9N407 TaxID=3375154 RepID=UPI0037BA516C
MTQNEGAEPLIDTTRPQIARVYDFLLGGRDNYPVDRQFGILLEEDSPIVVQLARENRYFLRRVVGYLADEAGIDQFVDIGSGLPTQENVHEVAQNANPNARVVYVDNDALVLAHARALLATDERTGIVSGDMLAPGAIIDHPVTRELIDFSRPVAVLLVSVLHFADDPDRALNGWREVMATGSRLVISHGEDDPRIERATAHYRQALKVGVARTREEIASMFTGLELVDPGLVPVPDWRPELARIDSTVATLPIGAAIDTTMDKLPMLGAVGRVPS